MKAVRIEGVPSIYKIHSVNKNPYIKHQAVTSTLKINTKMRKIIMNSFNMAFSRRKKNHTFMYFE